LAIAVKLALQGAPRTKPSSKRLLLSAAACQTAAMPRVDRYDIIGMVLLALVAALWVLHFSLPAPPPPDIVP
jgi:hypothetical protein